jgi:hypothetical protein
METIKHFIESPLGKAILGLAAAGGLALVFRAVIVFRSSKKITKVVQKNIEIRNGSVVGGNVIKKTDDD